MNDKMQIASAVLAALVTRPDSGLFNYDEKAEMAFLYAEALERRFIKEHRRAAGVAPAGTPVLRPGIMTSTDEVFAAYARSKS